MRDPVLNSAENLHTVQQTGVTAACQINAQLRYCWDINDGRYV